MCVPSCSRAASAASTGSSLTTGSASVDADVDDDAPPGGLSGTVDECQCGSGALDRADRVRKATKEHQIRKRRT